MVYVNFPQQWNTGTAYQGTLAGEEVMMANGQSCSEFSIPEERMRCLRSAANETCLKQYPDVTSDQFKKCYSNSVLGYTLRESSADASGRAQPLSTELILIIVAAVLFVLFFAFKGF